MFSPFNVMVGETVSIVTNEPSAISSFVTRILFPVEFVAVIENVAFPLVSFEKTVAVNVTVPLFTFSLTMSVMVGETVYILFNNVSTKQGYSKVAKISTICYKCDSYGFTCVCKIVT